MKIQKKGYEKFAQASPTVKNHSEVKELWRETSIIYKNTKIQKSTIHKLKDALNAEIQKINPFRGQRALGRNPYYSNYLCFLSANSPKNLKCNFNSLGNLYGFQEHEAMIFCLENLCKIFIVVTPLWIHFPGSVQFVDLNPEAVSENYHFQIILITMPLSCSQYHCIIQLNYAFFRRCWHYSQTVQKLQLEKAKPFTQLWLWQRAKSNISSFSRKVQ